jgi:hypothetical protein
MMDDKYLDISDELLKGVEEFSGHQLLRKDDLLKIFRILIDNNLTSLLEDIVFTAKSVRSLMRVIKSGSNNPEVENLDQAKKDFTDNMNKFLSQLKEINAKAESSVKSHFENEYLEVNQKSFHNLNELLSDLDWTRKYLKDQKRGKTNS